MPLGATAYKTAGAAESSYSLNSYSLNNLAATAAPRRPAMIRVAIIRVDGAARAWAGL